MGPLQHATVVMLAVNMLDKPMVLLRPVRKNTVDYHELKDAIKNNGFDQSILVRPKNGRYEIVDGFWRFSVATDLGITEVPCVIREMTDDEVMAAQVRMNAVRPKTDRMEFAKHLARILKSQPGLTLSDLSVMCNKSEAWVQQQLSLTRIKKAYQPLVSTGELSVVNAYALAKLPHTFQDAVIKDAVTMLADEFKRYVAGYVQQVMIAARDRKLHAAFVQDFVPTPYLRPLKEVHKEFLETDAGIARLVATNAKSALDGWKLALEWALNLDPSGIEAQRTRANERLRKNLTRESKIEE